MRTLILAAATIAAMSSAAMATEVNGVVAKYNPQVRVITLTDGQSYTIPMDVAIPPQLVPGQKVAIDQHDNGAKIDSVLVGAMM